jgi:predicted HD superfamily hydrolase involved in NAD metabolism
LAKRWGADEARAELAGWLHDIAKERSEAEILRMLGQDGIMAQQTVRRPKPVWHGPCAAVFAKNNLLVRDGDVLSAVACHTTGKPGMNLLDKVLFVADMISAERDFDGVGELRRMADEDLDKTVVEIMRRSMAYVRQRGKPLDEESVLALKDMENKA